MNYILKRDGRKVPFNSNKIIDAVLAAFKEVDGKLSDYAYIKAGNIADFIQEAASAEDRAFSVEEIQDLVERGLMATKRKDVAKAYVLYRDERTKERNRNSKLLNKISNHLNATDVKNQNANMDEYSFGGRKGEASNAMMKQYALDYCMSDLSRENHLNNEIYIHDLDSYAIGMHNCLSIPFDDLLQNGFKTRQTDIRPANSISTAFQLVAVIFQLQSLQQFGGVSATHLDWTMVPYVRKSFAKHFKDGIKYCYDEHIYWEDMDHIPNEINFGNPNNECHADINSKAYNYALAMTKKELKQAAEGMYHNLSNWAA